jgi:hypothetical protein
VGADTGAWGGILNAVIGQFLDDGFGGTAIPGASTVAHLDPDLSSDFSAVPNEPDPGSELALYLGSYDSLKAAAADTTEGSGVPPGIDQTVWLLSKSLDLAEWLVLDIANRVTTLEAADPDLMAGRLSQSSPQTIPRSSGGTPMVWGTSDLNLGGVANDTNQLTVPVGGAGLWQLYASISMKHQAKQDDGRFIRVIIARGNQILSDCRHPYTTNGAHATLSGNVTVEASVIDTVLVAEEGETFQVWVEHGDVGTSSPVVDTVGSFFFATRITKELP